MRTLVIDLNNFSRYPTLPVGLIVAVLRRAGFDVDVLSPLARTAEFLRDATEAGISVRLTTILGYAGEDYTDVDATTDFLRSNRAWIERVMLNRFSLMLVTDRRAGVFVCGGNAESSDNVRGQRGEPGG